MENYLLHNTIYQYLRTDNIVVDLVLSSILISCTGFVLYYIKKIINYQNIKKFCRNWLDNFSKEREILVDGYYSINPWNGMVKNDFPLIIDALFWYLNKHENINIIKKLRIHIPNASNYISSSDKNESRDIVSPLKLNMIYRPQDGVKIKLNENISIKLIDLPMDTDKRENCENISLFRLQISISSTNWKMHKLQIWLNQIATQYDEFQRQQLATNQKIFTTNITPEGLKWYEEDFTSNKSWDTLFCTNKALIKNKLDFFLNNKEWYRSRGIPWTFGVMSYGPPGCVKTSLEKVFLNYLGRHGIQIQLGDNNTYDDIRQIFYSPYINNKYIPIDKRVYIIPDIDAMGKVLLKRKLEEEKENITKETVTKMNAEELLMKLNKTKKSCNYPSNYISLSQILNLLDGIVEMDGRILIACTNHKEKLDPALIRPGRIDCIVELGHCTQNMLKEILENFYEEKIDINDLKHIKYHKFSPCEVYEFCFRNPTNLQETISLLNE